MKNCITPDRLGKDQKKNENYKSWSIYSGNTSTQSCVVFFIVDSTFKLILSFMNWAQNTSNIFYQSISFSYQHNRALYTKYRNSLLHT